MVLMSDISEHSIFIPVNNRDKPTMRNVELLSPAKNLECGIEAIKHGADAVYIGGPNFGARVAASNSSIFLGYAYMSHLIPSSTTTN